MGGRVLEVTGMTHDGRGVGRLDGRVVFVPGALPGETVRVEPGTERNGPLRARLLGVLRASPDRAEPFCPVTHTCGGCSLQHLSYPGQLREKCRRTADTLARIGRVPDADALVLPVLGMDAPLACRATVQFAVSADEGPAGPTGPAGPAGLGQPGRARIGFHARVTHRVVDTDRCPVALPPLDAVRRGIRRLLDEAPSAGSPWLHHIAVRAGVGTGQVLATLVVPDFDVPALEEGGAARVAACVRAEVEALPGWRLQGVCACRRLNSPGFVLDGDIRVLAGTPWMEEAIGGLRFRISPQAFFQVNPVQAEVLFGQVLAFAGLAGHETVVDLYCGTGAISLLLARKALRVVGVDSTAEAVGDARANAKRNGIRNAVFHAGAAETVFPGLAAEGLRADVLVLDPPRSGCDPRVLRAIGDLSPGRVVYVSCDPATLARDAAVLSGFGYAVERVQPVDMFPWTAHVETIVLMSRAEAGHA